MGGNSRRNLGKEQAEIPGKIQGKGVKIPGEVETIPEGRKFRGAWKEFQREENSRRGGDSRAEFPKRGIPKCLHHPHKVWEFSGIPSLFSGAGSCSQGILGVSSCPEFIFSRLLIPNPSQIPRFQVSLARNSGLSEPESPRTSPVLGSRLSQPRRQGSELPFPTDQVRPGHPGNAPGIPWEYPGNTRRDPATLPAT